VTVCNNRK